MFKKLIFQEKIKTRQKVQVALCRTMKMTYLYNKWLTSIFFNSFVGLTCFKVQIARFCRTKVYQPLLTQKSKLCQKKEDKRCFLCSLRIDNNQSALQQPNDNWKPVGLTARPFVLFSLTSTINKSLILLEKAQHHTRTS